MHIHEGDDRPLVPLQAAERLIINSEGEGRAFKTLRATLTVAKLCRFTLLLLREIPRLGGQFSLPPSLNDFVWAKHPPAMP